MNWLFPMWSRLEQMRALCMNIAYKHNYHIIPHDENSLWNIGHQLHIDMTITWEDFIVYWVTVHSHSLTSQIQQLMVLLLTICSKSAVTLCKSTSKDIQFSKICCSYCNNHCCYFIWSHMLLCHGSILVFWCHISFHPSISQHLWTKYTLQFWLVFWTSAHRFCG
jgi:hypothetical protein